MHFFVTFTDRKKPLFAITLTLPIAVTKNPNQIALTQLQKRSNFLQLICFWHRLLITYQTHLINLFVAIQPSN